MNNKFLGEMKAKRFVRVRGLFLYPTIPSIIRVVTPDEDENFISIRHYEERPLRRGNLMHLLCHSEEFGVF